MEKIMTNGLSNFEVLKQKISTSPKDNYLKGQQPHAGEVLIVDDEESFVLSLAEGLSVYRKFFNLRTAPNGAEAVKVLKLSAIDLVITDLSMPKMDGFELLAYMNRNYPKIPVILITAYGTPKIEEIVSNMGIFRYLEKPLDINSVADNIFDALGIRTSPISEEIRKMDSSYKPSAPFAQRAGISASDVQNKIALVKKASEEEKNRAKAEAQAIAEMESKSKTVATFGSRNSLSASGLENLQKQARTKSGAKTKDHAEKKSTTDAEKQAAEAAEKRALLEAKAKAEAERFAREEAELKIKEAEERAKQETLAREEAQRKTRDAEERAKQEALAREEEEKKAKAEAKVQTEEKARQEAQAREEAEKKAKAEAKAQAEEKARQEAELNAKEAQTQLTDKTQKDLKKEKQKKLSAWKKGK